jgi:hypothetical protein
MSVPDRCRYSTLLTLDSSSDSSVFVVKARQSRSESCETCFLAPFVFISERMTRSVWKALPRDFKVTWIDGYGFVLHPD